MSNNASNTSGAQRSVEKNASEAHEAAVIAARDTAAVAVATAKAAYNGLSTGYATFAAAVVSAEATRDAAIAASASLRNRTVQRSQEQNRQPTGPVTYKAPKL